MTAPEPHVMTPALFVTGTNTGVGKTAVAAALLRLAGLEQIRAVGLKPVASGSVDAAGAGPLRNADALELQSAAPLPLPYDLVNPYCFEAAIAPHVAAQDAGRPILLPDLVEWYGRASAGAELAIVEGAGGWRVPLHPDGFLSDLPETLGCAVVLVVGLTLGCLNHARLTVEAIHGGGRCRFAGWIANDVDPGFERRQENLATLERLLGSPPLAEAGWTNARSATGGPALDLGAAPRLRQALRAAAGR
jgi:dethiobiotin synthetase